MSELEDIAAGMGISIVEKCEEREIISQSELSLETDHNKPQVDNIEAELLTEKQLEEMFSNRYSESDPDYVENLKQAESIKTPPCIHDFFCRPPRNQNWNNRGGGHHRDGGWRGGQGRGGWGGGGRGGWGGGAERGDGYNNDWRGSRGGYHNNDRRHYGGGYADREDNRYSPYRRNDRNRDGPPHR